MTISRSKPDLTDWIYALEQANCEPNVLQVSSGAKPRRVQARCPAHADTNPSLSLTTGRNVPVVVKCFAGCDYYDIVKALGNLLPGQDDPPMQKQIFETVQHKQQMEYYWFKDIPKDRLVSKGYTFIVEAVYLYYRKNDDLCGAVLRLRGKDGKKQFRQYSYSPQNAPKPETPWAAKSMDAPRPLYGLSLLEENEYPVWVVEGEKAAEKLNELIALRVPEHSVVVTWCGGANAVSKTDWSPLFKRSVRILSDADDAGRNAARQIGHILYKSGNENVKILLVDGNTGTGPDDIAERSSLNNLIAMVKDLSVPNTPIIEDAVAKRQAWGGFKHVFSPGECTPSEMFRDVLNREQVQIRYNVRSARREIRKDRKPWVDANERVLSNLRVAVMDNYGLEKGRAEPPRRLRYSDREWRMMLESIDYETEIDPFTEWLEQLPAWDRTERIDFWLSELFTRHPQSQASQEIMSWASRFPLIAPIQLAYLHTSFKPEDQIDTRPLFVGPKGIGKSKMLRTLIPSHHSNWHSDSFVISANLKTMVEAIQGCVLVEAQEITGLNRNSLNAWKAFSTSKIDKVRLTWRKDAGHYPRLAVVIATTDQLRCIPDDFAGWRRDVPILLGHAPKAVEPWIMAHREQLWAEALFFFRKGMRAGLPLSLKEAAKQFAHDHRKRNDVVEDAFNKVNGKIHEETTIELLQRSNLARTTAEAARLSQNIVSYFTNLLIMHDYEQTDLLMMDGSTKKVWKKKENREQ